ncbi:MAG: hypothetical protein KFH98_13585, partial [Gemmatimonadetes bacterium]|nr:hypothetical protein [Gemmatimonadota bacterium]
MTRRRRLLFRRYTVLATLFVAACLTPTDGGVSFGELRVQPVYSAGEEPETIGINVDSLHVVIRRAGASVSEVDTVMPYRSGALAWLLELETVADDMRVELALRARGSVVYQGGRLITVTEGSVGRATTEDVVVGYLGTVFADRVEVRPTRLVFSTIGLSRELDAVAYDAHGEVVTGRQFDWSADDMVVATVDQTGRVIAAGVGSTLVHASADGVSDAATVLVDTLLALRGRIDADSASLSTSGVASTRVLVRILDAGGDLVGASAGTVVLSTTLGSLGDVIDHDDGTYTATFSAGATEGIALISGTLDGLGIGDSAVVQLRPTDNEPDPVTTKIDADSAAIDADGTSTTQVTVEVRDANGNLVGIGGADVQLSTT